MCGHRKVKNQPAGARVPCRCGSRSLGRLEFCWYSPTIPTARHSGAPSLMPTYEYSCAKCGKNFDAFQSMRDEAFRECPQEKCQLEEWGHGRVKRLLGTGAGLIFKGSGFYITDYRSNSYKEGAKKDAPASTPSSSGAEKPSGGGKEAGSSSTTPATPSKPAETKSTKPAADS